MITDRLTETQQNALAVLRAASGVLDYNRDLFGFVVAGAARSERIQMVTAKALIKRGLVVATRKVMAGHHEVIDQIKLADTNGAA